MRSVRTRKLVVALAIAVAGAPLITTATCGPYRGTFDFFRDDDYRDRGFLDWFVEDIFYYGDYYYDYYYDPYYYDDCCYSDYYYEGVIIFP